MQGLLTIAHLTWLEARRRRIVLAALICGIGFVVVYAIAVYFMNRSFSTAGLQRQLSELKNIEATCGPGKASYGVKDIERIQAKTLKSIETCK